MRRTFGPRGLGFALVIPELETEVACTQPTAKSGDVWSEVSISSSLHGIRSSTGELHRGRMNLSSVQARKTLADYLTRRAGGPIEGLDWQDILEDFCGRVLRARRKSVGVVRVGDRPARITPRFQVAPVVPYHRVTTLFGAGGSGKSTMATALGVSVQTGLAIIPGFTPNPTNVLFLDWETDEDDIDEKVKAIARGAGIGDTVTLYYLACHGRSFADQVEAIAEARQEVDAGMVIVDSVVHAAGTSSSEGADAAETTIRLYNAFAQLDCTVLVVDHVDKASAMDPNRPAKPYGSIFKENMARQAFEVRRSESQGTRSSIGLYNTKANASRRLSPIGLWVEQTDDGSVIRYGREEIKGDLLRPLSMPAQIDAVLAAGALHLADIAEALGLDGDDGKAKVRATLSRGKGARFVSLGDGRWGRVSHAG